MEHSDSGGDAMESSNRRADYRVEVPASLVRELAIWSCPGKDILRLGAAELGLPHLVMSRLGAGSVTLSDLSIRGMGIHVDLPHDVTSKLLAAKACFTYLQLLDSSFEDPYGILSIFTYCNLVRVAHVDGRLFLGVRFVRFAVGSRLEKALEFLDAQCCGVTALARWCDNLARGAHVMPDRHDVGLDLDHLLEEVELALAHSRKPGEETAHDPAQAQIHPGEHVKETS
jgi:hypothetical protein